jgi:hypothetical protein
MTDRLTPPARSIGTPRISSAREPIATGTNRLPPRAHAGIAGSDDDIELARDHVVPSAPIG